MRDEDRHDPSPVSVDDEIDAALRGEDASDAKAKRESTLVNDMAALVEDGRNLFEAEIAFQKTRLAFAANRSKQAVISGLFALAFIHLALIALVVGLVIALTPLVTAWGATAIVVGLLLLGAFILMMRVKNSTEEIGQAFDAAAPEGEE